MIRTRILSSIMMIAALSPAAGLCEAGEKAKKDPWAIDFTFRSGFYKQEWDPGDRLKVDMPDYLLEELATGPKGPMLDLDGNTLSDNPLLHGAMYSRLRMTAARGGVRLWAGLLAEHRGASYGVYSTGDTEFIPRFHASIDTCLGGAESSWRAGVSAGNFDDFRLGEGLTIYNMDVQGGVIYLEYDRLRATYTQIADLSAGIGLGIGDLYDLSLVWRDLTLPMGWKAQAGAGYFSYYINKAYDDGHPDEGFNFTAALERESGLRIYTQLGMRRAGGEFEQDLKSAGHVAGVSFSLGWRRFTASVTAERRFYGRYFNLSYKSDEDEFIYRSPDMTNTVGPYLYPLENFDRPLSQWAVYTEYQGRDVATNIFRCDGRCDLGKGLSGFLSVDLNHIVVSNEDDFLYPFYDAGLEWAPAEGLALCLSHTNRAMNLDMHYPTLYLLEKGTVMVTLGADLAF